MDFWARQAETRSRSRWLVLLFLAAVAATVAGVDVVVLGLLGLLDAGHGAAPPGAQDRALIVTSLCTLAVIGVSSLYRVASLSSGGGAVARLLGGTRVPTDTTDPAGRRLLNVVEEMAIACGLPVPTVYVLEHEEGINAFTAGHTPANAAIAVTRGALAHLERAELQGVVAHEVGHILNGDMRLNIRLMGLLYGLIVIGLLGRTIWWNAPRRIDLRRGEGAFAVALAGALVMAVGWLGLFFARLIQASVSRQRELLADATAIQLTRDSTGLRDALVKVGSVESSRLRNPGFDEVAHMLFAPGGSRWFATHPPLAERIRAIDPSFDPASLHGLRLEVTSQPLGVMEVVEEPLPASLQAPAPGARPWASAEPAALRGLVGNPGPGQLRTAERLRRDAPPVPASGLGRAGDAAAHLLALALDPGPAVRAAQLAQVRQRLGAVFADLAAQCAPEVAALPAEQRLPYLSRLLPALRELPVSTRLQVLDCLAAMARVDGHVGVFEFVLATLARTYLADGIGRPPRARPVRLAAAGVELQVLFSSVAATVHDDRGEAARAYDAGTSRLPGVRPAPFRPVPGWAAALDAALRCLDGLAPADKAAVLEALAVTVGTRATVAPEGAELLRAITAALHCPLPPFAADSTVT